MFAEDRFGRRLRKEREDRAMTQADVARVLEEDHGLRLHATAIAKMEQRDAERPRAIRLYEAQAIAEMFGLTVDEMMSTADSEIEALSREFAQLGAQAEQLRADVSRLFDRMRANASFMAVPEGQATPELKASRQRIIRALAALHETEEDRKQRAASLLYELTYEPVTGVDVAPEVQEALSKLGQEMRRARMDAQMEISEVIRQAKFPNPARAERLIGEMEGGDFLQLERLESESKQAVNIAHAYLRQYARVVGMDPDVQVERYERAWGRRGERNKRKVIRVKRSR